MDQEEQTVPEALRASIEVSPAAAQIPNRSSIVQDSNGNLFPVNEVIVDLNQQATRQDAMALAAEVNGVIVGFVPSTNAYQVRLSTTSIPELESAINVLLSDPRVERAMKNVAVTFLTVPTDLANLQDCDLSAGTRRATAYSKIWLQQAWDFLQDRNPPIQRVLVAVLDSGINSQHQEFRNPAVRLGASPPADTDPLGHGTGVAAIIGANNVPVSLGTCSASDTQSLQMTGVLAGVPGINYKLRVGAKPSELLFWKFMATFSADMLKLFDNVPSRTH